jgi:predicted deacylase
MASKEKERSLRIGDAVIEPGERRVVNLPVANVLAHDSPLTLPVHVVRGTRPGPVMFVSAAIHGDELNGIEIVRRLLGHRALTRMAGTLLAVPVVNGFGMMQQSRYLPDRRDLNRSFPGSRTGSLAARLANLFVEEIVSQSDYGIDLHTAATRRDNIAQIRANLDDPETLELARAFGVPVVLHASVRDGSLRETASALGVRTLLFEAGEALRFDELALRLGVDGVIRVMRAVGMLARRNRRARAEPVVARSTSWVRAPATGVVSLTCKLGDPVVEGTALAVIADPYQCFELPLPVKSPLEGVVIGLATNPLIYEGDALVHIARYREPAMVAGEIESLQSDVLGLGS